LKIRDMIKMDLERRRAEVLLKKGFQSMALMALLLAACLWLSSHAGKRCVHYWEQCRAIS
ncbi:MAG: hypothetical protein J6X14_02795, partial [Lachnospiraceae bacterium]|nr:hypothetical protein [Lachnospiraceae bacterium]